MKNKTEDQITYLLNKIDQHEETIAQLVLMVAETNRKLKNIVSSVKETH